MVYFPFSDVEFYIDRAGILDTAETILGLFEGALDQKSKPDGLVSRVHGIPPKFQESAESIEFLAKLTDLIQAYK